MENLICQNRCLAFFQKAFFQAFFYKKAIQKLHALARVINFAHPAKHKNLMKASIPSQFNYCPLILLFYSKQLSNRINRIHEGALKLVYKDNKLTFNERLEQDNLATIHR